MQLLISDYNTNKCVPHIVTGRFNNQFKCVFFLDDIYITKLITLGVGVYGLNQFSNSKILH